MPIFAEKIESGPIFDWPSGEADKELINSTLKLVGNGLHLEVVETFSQPLAQRSRIRLPPSRTPCTIVAVTLQWYMRPLSKVTNSLAQTLASTNTVESNVDA